MSKIVVYPIKPTISDDDMVIGTDVSGSNATKNFSIGAISAYIMAQVATFVNNAISAFSATIASKRGVFYSLVNHVASAPNNPFPLEMGVTDSALTSGVSVALNGSSIPCRLTFPTEGIYKIGISAQIANADNAKQDIMIWLSRNGEPNFISNTTKRFSLHPTIPFGTAYAEYIIEVAANDYISPMWMTSNVGMSLNAAAAGSNYASKPSLYVTVTKI